MIMFDEKHSSGKQNVYRKVFQSTSLFRSESHKLPVDLNMFWSSMLNKVPLQEYF